MRTETEIVDNLRYVFDSLKDGSIDPHRAGEMSNAVGKRLRLIDMQLKYYELTKQMPPVMPALQLNAPIEMKGAAGSNGASETPMLDAPREALEIDSPESKEGAAQAVLKRDKTV